MEGVETKIEWRINEACLRAFRTQRSGGFARRSGYCGGGCRRLLSRPATSGIDECLCRRMPAL